METDQEKYDEGLLLSANKAGVFWVGKLTDAGLRNLDLGFALVSSTPASAGYK